MDNRSSANKRTGEFLKRFEELKRDISSVREKIEELEEDIDYLVDIFKRYISQAERSRKVDFLLVNILFFLLGLLLGFTGALLLFKFQ